DNVPSGGPSSRATASIEPKFCTLLELKLPASLRSICRDVTGSIPERFHENGIPRVKISINMVLEIWYTIRLSCSIKYLQALLLCLFELKGSHRKHLNMFGKRLLSSEKINCSNV
ncbi:hypothetical protein L9F63_016449, partial [Diploptera punctata]